MDISRNPGTDDHKKKLTRQRKLRYVTDDEVCLKKSQSLPVSPGSDSGAQTPHRAVAGHWSKSAVAQPLPLPEVNSPITRTPPNQILGKTKPNLTGRSNIAPTYCSRGFPEKLDIDTAKNDFRLHFPTKSAPSTSYSSPVLSPQRYQTVDLFHPSYKILSDFKASTSDRLSTSYHASLMPTPDQSPLHGPALRTPPVIGNTTTYNRGCLNKSLPESWHDNCNGNVHPLPRPPIVFKPSPRTRHNIDRSDGSLVKGMWQKGKPIGRGTYGSVYVATHRETGATCAVKEVEIFPDDPKCAECIKQLEQEMKFLRELKHPNIVEYYGYEVLEDRFCIYLEYVHPGSINKYVHEHCGAMTESIVRNFTRHILSGLAYLHSTKTIHRDIKGANLLVNASGVVKLADFGLAKHLAGQDISLSLKGTPHWMSPEVLQAFMRKDANPEVAYGVDIWSVGCTVIEMLTGKPPWSEYNGVQAMFNILNKEPPIPESLSAEGKDFLQRCFQRRPEDRPSASKLLEHPFLRSSHDQNIGSSAHELTGAKLHNVQSWPARNINVMPLSSVTRIQDRVLSMNRETSRQPCQGSVDLGLTTTHHSPRSILEDLHSTSSPDLNRYLNSSRPSNVQNNVFSKASNNNIYNFSCKGTSHFKK